MGINEYGNYEIYVSSGAAMVPETAYGVNIGTSALPFGSIYVDSNSGVESINAEGRIFLGGAVNARFTDMPITIQDAGATSGAFVGGDLNRNDDLFIYTHHAALPAKSAYFLAGVRDEDSYYTDAVASTGQTGMTHKNIEYMVDANDYTFLSTSSGGNLYLIPGSKKIYVRGSLEGLGSITPSVGSASSAWKAYLSELRGIQSNTYNISTYGNLIPGGTYNVGASDNKWNAGYFNNIYATSFSLNNQSIGEWNDVGDFYYTASTDAWTIPEGWDAVTTEAIFSNVSVVDFKYMFIKNYLVVKFLLSVSFNSAAIYNNSKKAWGKSTGASALIRLAPSADSGLRDIKNDLGETGVDLGNWICRTFTSNQLATTNGPVYAHLFKTGNFLEMNFSWDGWGTYPRIESNYPVVWNSDGTSYAGKPYVSDHFTWPVIATFELE